VPELVRLLSEAQLDSRVRVSIASTLGELGERSIVPELVRLLPDQQVDFFVRERIVYVLGELGEQSIVPELVRIFSNSELDIEYSLTVALENLAQDEKTIASLLSLLASPNNKHLLIEILWMASRRAGVWIIRTDKVENPYEMIKW
jgi:HEAT repeat protein